ncbi:uncharacterized protein KY384_000197 [Bacidia gigantensis]|uniref:uncharacterized protein n=1 Tax=Bacidia gigantensis TaxID=2732470 RepID=UPI001D053E89|nr:uncharacterized protein KY384_000197 [Bacidia gigantensis]KAG8526204.1 hypothetical protein KY384_000197 [Bacidia gigantensis]
MSLPLSSRLLIVLACSLRAVSGNPVGAISAAKPTEQQSADKTIVTTTTEPGSTYTLTYTPSIVTADTTLIEGCTTAFVYAEAIVGALLGGPAVAALPFVIPKAIPPNLLDGEPVDGGRNEGDDDQGCQKITANICTEECTTDWFHFENQPHTTSTCAAAASAKTTGCDVTDTTKTNSHPIPTPSVTTLTTTTNSGNPSAAPFDYLVIQVYLGQEYQRLHIDDNGGTAEHEADCEDAASKGVLGVMGVKVRHNKLHDNIADFCKQQKGSTASSNYSPLLTYDQDEYRMQAVLQVSYTGNRGEGATYTLDDEQKCNDLFSKILTCGPDKNHTGGDKMKSEKRVFAIEPSTYLGALGCAPDDYKWGVQASEALDNIDDFCGNFDGQRINQGERKDAKYQQAVGGLMSTISVTWEPKTGGCEKGGAHDHGYPINKTINDCNKGDPKFKAAGTNTDQCAIYQIYVESRETVVCGSDPLYPQADRDRWKSFSPKDAHDAIDDFCGKNLQANPAARDDSGGFSQDGRWPKGIATGGNNSVSIKVTFHSQDDLAACPADTKADQAFNTGGDDCQRRLGKMVVDGCDPSGDKHGGWLLDSSYNGCVQWQIGSIAAPGD